MGATIIDGKALAAATKVEAAEKVRELKSRGINPCLAVILVGENPASQVYVRGKAKDCGDCGIDSRVIRLPEETSLYRNQTKRHIFEILKSAQIEFDLKTAVYEVICKDTTILEKISELQGMNLDHDLQGAIMELLTAQAE